MLLPLNRHWGVDIGGTTAVIGFLSDTGFTIEDIIMTEADDREKTLFSRISSVILSTDASPATLGVGIAGLIDRTAGKLITSPNLPGYENTAVGEIFSEVLNCPVTVDNDANSFAAGILASGALPSNGLWLMITIGTGIGGAIIQDGRIIYGTGHAGEFGHTTIVADGISCACGSRGCWEQYTSKNALLRYYEALIGLPANISTLDICRLADRMDENALASFREFGYWMGIGLANLAACFSPHGMVLGGGLAGAFEHFACSAREEYTRRSSIPWNISPVEHTDSSGAEGAALIGAGVSH